MSDSNRVRLAYVEESTWGVTPDTPQTQQIRFTGESLNRNITNVVSKEIRSDRQISGLAQVSKDSSGDINFEFSYGTYDDFLESALFSAFGTTVNFSGSDIAADATGLTSSTTDFTTKNLIVGQWIKAAGFTGNAANNKYYKVLSISANDLNLSPAPPAIDSAGETVTISGTAIRNGTTQKSFTIEKGLMDISEFFKFTGQIVNTLSLNITSEQIITGTFGFMGKDGSLSSTSLDSTPTSPTDTDVVTSSVNVNAIREGGIAISTSNIIQSLSFTLNNNLRKKPGVAFDSLVGMGAGACVVTGNVKAYFDNSDIMDKFYNGTESSLDYLVEDDDGNAYMIDFPRIKYESASAIAQGENQDIFADLNFRALVDPTLNYTIQICKF